MELAAHRSAFVPQPSPIAPGDTRLASRISDGDEQAFARAYERHMPALVRYCRGILLMREDAEDVAQDAMLAALAALRGGDSPPQNLRAWLYRVAHNNAISLLRRRREHDLLDDMVTQAGDDVVSVAAVRARVRQLVTDLRSLPHRQRSALVMRELSGLDYTEIAAVLECSEAAAMQTVFEARSALLQFEQGRELECTGIQRLISTGDRRTLRARRVRAHIRGCDACVSFERSIATRTRDLRLLFPVVAVKGGLAGLLGALGLHSRAAVAVHSRAAVAVHSRAAVALHDRAAPALRVPGVRAALIGAVITAGGVVTVAPLQHLPQARPPARPAVHVVTVRPFAAGTPKDVAVVARTPRPRTRVARVARTKRTALTRRRVVTVRPRTAPPLAFPHALAAAPAPQVRVSGPPAATPAPTRPAVGRAPATTSTIAAQVNARPGPARVAAAAGVSVGTASGSATAKVDAGTVGAAAAGAVGAAASAGAVGAPAAASVSVSPSSASAGGSVDTGPVSVTSAAQLP